jgi:hypothetical protein
MIDSLLPAARRARRPTRCASTASTPRCCRRRGGYGVVTLHRPSNVDDAHAARSAADAAPGRGALPLVFAMHPRTRSNIERFGLATARPRPHGLLPPQGYLEMLGLMAGATLVLTDSGGLQEETTALGVPCLTLRENTERPITVEQGTNTMVGRDRRPSCAGVADILAGRGKRGRVPEYWDGHAPSASRPTCTTGCAPAERDHPRPSPPCWPPITNALTIDVEDYFQVSAFAPYIRARVGQRASAASSATSIASWRCWTSGHAATFFTLGWVAERYPQLVRASSRRP